jgi:hypothetical protein
VRLLGLSRTQRELYEYCDKNDFVTAGTIEEFRRRLEQENNIQTLSFALEKFINDTCPNCSATGAFKYHFMGKLRHPHCGWSWYVDPGTYIASQFKAVFRTGAELGGDMIADAEKRGERGCGGAIVGFILGAIIRLPFALVMIPIQLIFSLSQRKPELKPSGKP